MSNIPKGERSESKLEVIHRAIVLRNRIRTALMLDFGYSRKNMEKFIQNMVKSIPDREQREAAAKAIREAEEDFVKQRILDTRKRIIDSTLGITGHLRAANTISPKYMKEFEERRVEMDRALICCNVLQDELEDAAISLFADKNKYSDIVMKVKSIFLMIKALRQSDNRFLKDIPH